MVYQFVKPCHKHLSAKHPKGLFLGLCRAVLVLQSTWRMLKHRRAFLRVRQAAVTVQSRVRGMQARKAYAELQQRHAAATAVQAAFKGHRARQGYLLQRDAAVAVQMGFRRRQVGCFIKQPVAGAVAVAIKGLDSHGSNCTARSTVSNNRIGAMQMQLA